MATRSALRIRLCALQIAAGLFFLAGAAILFPAVCPAAAPADAPLPVAVSIPPQRCFVEQIGGPDVSVTVLVDKGRDPHSYEPTAAQMVQVGKAVLYFAVDLPFESQWLPRFQSLNKNMTVLRHIDVITRLHGKPDLALRSAGSPGRNAKEHGHDHGLEGDDPHIWLSPRVVLQIIPQICDALSRARPEKRAEFQARAAAFTATVSALDARMAALFAPLPRDRRTFLTFHQGWAYFAHNYDLREASVELQGKEPGPKGMAALLDFAAREKIRVVVTDPMANAGTVAAIASNIKARVIAASPLDPDWPGEMWRVASALSSALAR